MRWYSIYLVYDENKDKDFEFEMIWICEEFGNKYVLVLEDLLVEVEVKVKVVLEEGMEED